jgi:hypothetical protein
MLPHCDSVQSADWITVTGVRRLRVALSHTVLPQHTMCFDAVCRHLVWDRRGDECMHLAFEYTFSSTLGVKAAQGVQMDRLTEFSTSADHTVCSSRAALCFPAHLYITMYLVVSYLSC